MTNPPRSDPVACGLVVCHICTVTP